jgi:RNA polymerase sigma-70 factor (ECF subfamily)
MTNPSGRAAETMLVQQYGPAVRRFFKRRVSCAAAVDDLFQDCCVLTITRLRHGDLRAPDKPEYFMIGVARRLLLAYVRGKVESRVVLWDHDELEYQLADSVSLEEAVEQEMLGESVRARLDDLQIARDREVLVRRYLLDEDTETVARELGITESEVRVVLCRARKRLRSAWGDLPR